MKTVDSSVETLGTTAVIYGDDLQRRKMADALAKAGLHVEVFDNAESFLASLASGNDPSLVVTDLYMEGIDGWKLCRLLRSPDYRHFNDTPILVVSATYTGEAPGLIAADLGANAFLPQSADCRELVCTARALLNREVPAKESRLLIVEDEPAMRKLLTATFEAQGYCVDAVGTGAEVMDRINISSDATKEKRDPSRYHVAVVDYHLPDTFGDVLLQHLREACPACAVVMVTADTDSELALKWMKAGAAAYACKPFHPQYLVELCEKAQRERSLLETERVLGARALALRKSEAFNAALFDYSPAETIVVDTAGSIVRWNKAKADSPGRSPVVGQRMYLDYAAHHENDMHGELMECIATGENRTFPEQRYGDRILSIKIAPFPPREPQGALIISEDITQQRTAEAQARQAQKLESIGTLAGGVAHEINNPINGIMNYAQLIKDRTDGSETSVCDFADEIVKETNRVTRIVRNLLAFARQENGERTPVRVKDIVEDAMSLTGAVMRRDQIRVSVDIPEELPDLTCHGQQIQQVIVNLLMNARDALNEKYPDFSEDKTVAVSAVPVESLYVAGEGDKTAGIRLSVEDHGPGICETVRARMFDPFFTTKPRGKGTGLGLSILHGIVHDHGGNVVVESEEGKWTRFQVDLPL